MIYLLEPTCGTGDNPLLIEHLQNYYADIMRDSVGVMDSGEAIFSAQAQVEFFFYYAASARDARALIPPLTTIT